MLSSWLASATTVAMLSTGVTASPQWHQQPQTIALLAIGLQGLLLLAFSIYIFSAVLRDNQFRKLPSGLAMDPLQQPEADPQPDQVGAQDLGVAQHRPHFE